MNESLNRRDFLKLLGLFSVNLAAPKLLFRPGLSTDSTSANVLIVVFDAFSAKHISIYGYGRQTMPNLTRLIEKATVYHEHYANGPFTTPGTASLLTGTLPWTHRALGHNDLVADHMAEKSIFHAFDEYHCMAYSHNILANTLLKQFLPAIDDYTPQHRLFLGSDTLMYDLLDNDDDIGPLAWSRVLKKEEDGHSYSLLMSRLYDLLQRDGTELYEEQFPRGLPNLHQDYYYRLEDGIDWLQKLLLDAPQPFMGYFHFLPPHFPYKTRSDFYDRFAGDGFKPPQKPDHIFLAERSIGEMNKFRRWYDEYILYVDSEFARLHRFMEENGMLQNTWLVLTSDHGEMFERGITGHQAPPMFQPLVRIPLVVFAPGQDSRVDIYQRTNAIDVLPTLMHITGQQIPDWAEGDVLPPYSSQPLSESRPIISLRGKGIKKGQPILKGSTMLIRDGYKLVYIFGYPKDLEGGELIELYHLDDDPEEMIDISATRPDIVDPMLLELKEHLAKTG